MKKKKDRRVKVTQSFLNEMASDLKSVEAGVLEILAERDHLKAINADLLEALRDIVRAYDRNMGRSALRLRIELARAAIAKAKGESK